MRIDEVEQKKTLYVSRKLLNTDDIVTWAVAQGLKSMLNPEELHVTICYSKTPVTWDLPVSEDNLVVRAIDDLNEDDSELDGLRKIEMFGKDKNVLVLQFGSEALKERHYEFRDHGASSDFPDYKSHLTITYDGSKIDLDDLEPYWGMLEFGPEIYKEITTNWDGVDDEIDLTDKNNVPMINDDATLSEFWFNPIENKILTESLDEDAAEMAFQNNWVRGVGNSLTGDKIAALRLAAAYLGERDYSLNLNLNGQWDVTLNSNEQAEFVKRGILPEAIADAAAPLPRRFWLSFNLPITYGDPEEVFTALERGEMVGLKGISDRRQIMTQFSRCAVLVMDPKETIRLNDLERFEYNNVESLVANNMAVLTRLYDRQPDVAGRAATIERVLGSMPRPMMALDYNCGYMMEYFNLAWKAGDVYKNSPSPINTVEDFAKVAHTSLVAAAKAWNKNDRDSRLRNFAQELKYEDVLKCSREILEKSAAIYSDEGEWAVRNSTFHIPTGSKLLIFVNNEHLAAYEEWKSNPDDPKWKWASVRERFKKEQGIVEFLNAHPGIRQRYDVRFIDARTFINSKEAATNRRYSK